VINECVVEELSWITLELYESPDKYDFIDLFFSTSPDNAFGDYP
jgi:hypothetical protein